LSHEAGLVPVVEPEVLMEGDHALLRHFEVTESVLRQLFHELPEHRVHLEGLLLKVNRVLSGTTCSQTATQAATATVADAAQATVADAAQATWCRRQRTVPTAVPGLVFLSGGQTDGRATEHLDALNRIEHLPREMS